VRHADVADHRTRPGDGQRLLHRLVGADAFQHGIGADLVGQRLDLGHAVIAALGHDVGRAVLQRQVLARLVAAHGDHAGGAELPRRQHAHQADRAVAHHHGGTTGLHPRRHGGVPAGAEHVGGGQQAGNQVVIGLLVQRDQRAVGQRHASELRLRTGHEFALHAGGLEAVAAVRTGVVRQAEGTDDELPRLDRGDGAADLDHGAAVLVAHVHRPFDLVQPAVGPQVGAADAGGGQPDGHVGRLLQGRLGHLLDAHVAGGVELGSQHGDRSSGKVVRPRREKCEARL